MWHLDSNIVTAFLNGRHPLDQKILDHLDDLAVSSLVLAELNFGARHSARSSENLDRLHEFIHLIQVVDFDESCAGVYGEIRLALRRKGRPSADMDMLIAATAVAHDAVLVTNNLKHFQEVDALRIGDWLG